MYVYESNVKGKNKEIILIDRVLLYGRRACRTPCVMAMASSEGDISSFPTVRSTSELSMPITTPSTTTCGIDEGCDPLLRAHNQANECTTAVYKFVLTGGPCAGKTTALKHMNQFFTDKG